MPEDQPDVSVTDNPAALRYELRTADSTVAGFATYALGDSVITFTHTEVDPSLEGRGLGGLLAREALTDVGTRGLRVVPECPFIAHYIERHPEFAALLDWED